jgi:hypothetical protein
MSKKRINETLVRRAPESPEALLELLFEGLEWPRPTNMESEDIPLPEWSPADLYLNPDEVSQLTKIQQIPPLTAKQPFGVFILSFDGGRLPVGAVRRVVNRLVHKRRARGKSVKSLWDMNDLIFFCQSSNGVGTLHVVAFRDSGNMPVMKVISWDTSATGNRVELIAGQSLPALCWPDGASVDPDQWREQWASAFTSNYREGIKSSAALASKMAEVGKTVRDEVLALYTVESNDGPLRQLFDEVKKNLRADLNPESFADMYAQTMVYGLLTARITHPEDFAADALNSVLRFENPFLDALYSSFRRQGDQAFDVDEFGLHDLAELFSNTNMEQVLADFGASERKDDPVVFFYEEFLERYAPEQKKALGTYYTPIPVVRLMVRAVDEIIKTEFGLPLGVADQTTWGEYSKAHGIKTPPGLKSGDKIIRMVDPATGTGTFLLEWMRQAESNLRSVGQYSPEMMKLVVEQMDAFEISLSSYAVAHLKTSLALDSSVRKNAFVGIRLADTLAEKDLLQPSLFSDDPIAVEGLEGERVKYETVHSVTLGNPPYLKVDSASAGGFILHRRDAQGRSLFDDFLDNAKLNSKFSHQASLYNLYVYFWRWALWKSFEQNPMPIGIVAFITASSWLNGPAFSGLREYLRNKCSSVYIVDLGGDNFSAKTGDQNIFGIQTPVAICIAVKGGQSNGIKMIRLEGDRESKLGNLESINLASKSWADVGGSGPSSFVGLDESSSWANFPPVVDLLPWQQPGLMWNKTWAVSPDPEVLRARWKVFVGESDLQRRSDMFGSSKTGRNIFSIVGGSTPLAELAVDAECPPIERFSHRSMDVQWALVDPRLTSGFRPVLWQVRERNLFMSTMITGALGSGPAATIAEFVMDKHHFSGRGGKDNIPLYRGNGVIPNVNPLLVDLLVSRGVIGQGMDGSELWFYVYAILGGSDYTARFERELTIPGPRVPLTLDPDLFREVSNFGRELADAVTLGRWSDVEDRYVRRATWVTRPTRAPESARECEWQEGDLLSIADGLVSGVSRAVWDFSISRMAVLPHWIGYRSLGGAGRSSSSKNPLDHVRIESWADSWCEELCDVVESIALQIDMSQVGTRLLDKVLSSECLNNSEIPPVDESLRLGPVAGGNLFGESD